MNIFFGAESLEAGNGGIAGLARLTAKVLGEESLAGNINVRCAVLSDTAPADEFGFQVTTARRSRLRFVCHVNRASMSNSHFIFCSLGMSRAHGWLPFIRRPFMTWMCGIEVWENTQANRIKNARKADCLLSISNYTAQRAYCAHSGLTHAKVCRLGTESDELPDMSQNDDTPPTVLIIAHMYENGAYKGQVELIECWPKVVSAVPDARLIIAGSGPGLGFLQQKAADTGAKNIDIKGFVPESEIEDLWQQATLFAMPSRSEGFGLVYVEAMRHGLPVIASVHDAAQEINIHEETGLNVNLEKPDELPDALIALMKDHGRASLMGRNGQKRWQEHFRYSAFKKRFKKHLYDFLENGS